MRRSPWRWAIAFVFLSASASAGTHIELRDVLKAYVELMTTGFTVFTAKDGCSRKYPDMATEYSRANDSYRKRNAIDFDEARDRIFLIARHLDGDKGVHDMRMLLKPAFDKIIAHMKKDSETYSRELCRSTLTRIRQGLLDTTTEANTRRLKIIMGFQETTLN